MRKLLILCSLFLITSYLAADDAGGAVTLNNPIGIWVSPAGTIYIADSLNHRIVQVDDMKGNEFKTYGSSGKTQGKFLDLVKVLQDATGQIYISDYGNDRLVRMDDLTGEGWTTYGSRGNGAGQFRGPYMIVGLDNKMYITDE